MLLFKIIIEFVKCWYEYLLIIEFLFKIIMEFVLIFVKGLFFKFKFFKVFVFIVISGLVFWMVVMVFIEEKFDVKLIDFFFFEKYFEFKFYIIFKVFYNKFCIFY